MGQGHSSHSFVRRTWTTLTIGVGLALSCVPISAGTVVTFRQGVAGYSGALDTELTLATPNTPKGSNSSITVDLIDPSITNGLLRFDNIFGSGAGQIPFGVVIDNAFLTFNVVDVSDSPTGNITLHRMLTTWDNNSTWNSMVNGVSANDTEALATPDGSVSDPTVLGTQTIPNLKAALQAWASGATNHGWVLLTDSDDGWDFSTAEEAVINSRPMLTVEWTPLSIVKRAFEEDGTPIPDGATLPSGMRVKFMLFVNNPGGFAGDVSLQDALSATFQYVSGSIKVDNTLSSSVVCPGGVCNEATIFTRVDSFGTPLGDGDSVAAPTDSDVGSSSASTVDFGNNTNPNNATLNIAADSVWAALFTVEMQ